MRDVLVRAMVPVRRLVYRLGFRPKPGTVLYSPSAALLDDLRTADIPGAMARGVERGARDARLAMADWRLVTNLEGDTEAQHAAQVYVWERSGRVGPRPERHQHRGWDD